MESELMASRPNAIVKLGFDAEAGVWVVDQSNVPGLVLEHKSLDILYETVPDMVQKLLNGDGRRTVTIKMKAERLLEIGGPARK